MVRDRYRTVQGNSSVNIFIALLTIGYRMKENNGTNLLLILIMEIRSGKNGQETILC